MTAQLRALRRLPLAIAVAAIVVSAGLAGPPPVAACSCVGPQPMSAYVAEPRTSVVTGVPGSLGDRGVPVRVTRWFKGPGASSIIWLSGDSFGLQSAACQRTPPTPGVELILVLWMPEDGSDPSGSICTPMATLVSAEGRAMFEDAMATFGPAAPAPSPAPSGSPAPAGSPATGDETGSSGGGVDPALLAAAVVAAALVLLLVAVGLVVARRRPGPVP